MFVEKKQLISIVGNSSNNNAGILEEDVNGNPLVSIVDLGESYLYQLVKYDGEDNLLLVDEKHDKIQLAKEGDLLNVILDFDKGTHYFVGAREILGKREKDTKSTFVMDSSPNNVFKVYLDNGIEIKNYTLEGNLLTVQGLHRGLIDDFSEIKIISYNSDKLTDESFEISYYGFPKIFDRDSMFSEDYFSFGNFVGREIEDIDNFTVNEKVSKDILLSDTRNKKREIVKKINNSFDLNTFSTTDSPDIFHYLGKDNFRLILMNNVFGRIVFCNNCRIDDGVSFNFQKQGNRKTSKVSFDNYIDILATERDSYGEGIYGEGIYSGNWIINSNRRRKE